jgi:transketolase
MSKGHCSAALYATLAYSGFFPIEQLAEYMKPLSFLNGHPDRNKVPGVEANTGPLGHGLPIGVGAAKAAKITRASWRTFVLTGDGELQEGSNWEAAMAASQYRLDNLTVIVDRNRLQQGDETERTVALEPLADRWRAFGWTVREVDGHDLPILIDTLRSVPLEQGHPTCVIAHTRKGCGVSFMENRVEWHHRVPTSEELVAALQELAEDRR